jgi:DedD protein
MDESLKARLIGAVVLVALAVLLIPELLSGRKPAAPVAEEGEGTRGTRTFTIELGQAPGQATRSPMTSAAPAPAATPAAPVPAPAATTVVQAPTGPPVASVAPPAASPEPEVAQEPEAAPEPEPRAEPQAPPAASARAGGWAVQVGAFGSPDTARKLVGELNGAGYRAFVSPVNRGGKTLYRVRVGPEDDRAGAEQVAPRLKARGLPATVVRND